MKRILLGFLMLTMLTPMLVCGVGTGMKEANAEMPCHGETADMDSMQDGVMFMSDCTGVGFQAASGDVSVDNPNLQIDKIVYVSTDETLPYSLLLTAQNTIRAPPDRESTQGTSPSLILTTQRFRI